MFIPEESLKIVHGNVKCVQTESPFLNGTVILHNATSQHPETTPVEGKKFGEDTCTRKHFISACTVCEKSLTHNLPTGFPSFVFYKTELP